LHFYLILLCSEMGSQYFTWLEAFLPLTDKGIKMLVQLLHTIPPNICRYIFDSLPVLSVLYHYWPRVQKEIIKVQWTRWINWAFNGKQMIGKLHNVTVKRNYRKFVMLSLINIHALNHCPGMHTFPYWIEDNLWAFGFHSIIINDRHRYIVSEMVKFFPLFFLWDVMSGHGTDHITSQLLLFSMDWLGWESVHYAGVYSQSVS